jgi:hypothetical protein
MRNPRNRPIFGSRGILRIVTVLLLLAGCSTKSTEYRTRPFFLPEKEASTHGRKAWYDRVLEVDPGGAEFKVAADYEQAPPKKIAVLPFTDLGDGSFVVDKIPLLRRSNQFTLVPLLAIDAALTERGITNYDQLNALSPFEIGRWLNADAIVYGEVVNYEAYYGFLVAAWRVTARVRMVSTRDGHELFSCVDTRYSTTVTPALDPFDIAINSALNVLELRDITLARAENEVGREIVLRLPVAERNVSDFKTEAAYREGSL